jgi:hypothetical protein
MKITRNVILDLLPMYVANEVSADTRQLIETYLETDTELANIVKHSAKTGLTRDIPVPLTQDDNLKAFKTAKRKILIQSIFLAIGIVLIVAVILYAFFVPA